MIGYLVVVLLTVVWRDAKVYKRCEFARELKFIHETPGHQLPVWVCIAEHESQYNTSALGRPNGDNSTDHGIFQINDRYWCSPPGKGHACGLPCSKFQDDDIADDYLCVQRIYKEHKHLSGDGFNAWAVYKPFCQGTKADKYIKGCFDDEDIRNLPSTPVISSPPIVPGFFGGIVGLSGDTVSSHTDTSIPDYTPKTSRITYFTPTTPISTIFSTSTPAPFVFSNPTTVSTTFTPLSSRSSFFNSPSTIFPSTSRSSSFFTSTTRPAFFHRSNVVKSFVSKPVFIVNGVKWYR